MALLTFLGADVAKFRERRKTRRDRLGFDHDFIEQAARFYESELKERERQRALQDC